MNSIQQQLMMCMAAYQKGEMAAERVLPWKSEDWIALYSMAADQKMVGIVFEMLWRSPDFCENNRALLIRWKQETIIETAAQAARSRRIADVSAALRRAQIPHALVKGLLCRELYQKGDLRISADEDLFIDPADEGRAGTVLKSEGFEHHAEIGGEDVTHWMDEQTGMHIELHTCLLPPLRKEEDGKMNAVFSRQLAHTVTCAVQGGEVDTLPPTEHFLFLVAHALRHFISCGVGVRTLCDVISFAQHYEGEIDFAEARRLLKETNSLGFLDQVFALGQTWLDFKLPAGWELSDVSRAEELLLDSLEGGIYGHSSENRIQSSRVVTDAIESRGEKTDVLHMVFPKKEKLAYSYPVLKQYPMALPAVWTYRIGKYAAGVLRSKGKGNSPIESLSLGKKRTEMMVSYGILPKGKTKN